MLEYYSLFQFETSERCSVLEIDRERLNYLSKSDDKLNDVLKELKAKMTIAGAKYDFSYWSISKGEDDPLLKEKILQNNKINKTFTQNHINQRRGILVKNYENSKTFFRQASTLMINIHIIKKIKGMKNRVAARIKSCKDLFNSIDQHYNERIALNMKKLQYYYDNIVVKRKIMNIAARSIDFSTTKSIPSLMNIKELPKSGFIPPIAAVDHSNENQSIFTDESISNDEEPIMSLNRRATTLNSQFEMGRETHSYIYSQAAKTLLRTQKQLFMNRNNKKLTSIKTDNFQILNSNLKDLMQKAAECGSDHKPAFAMESESTSGAQSDLSHGLK